MSKKDSKKEIGVNISVRLLFRALGFVKKICTKMEVNYDDIFTGKLEIDPNKTALMLVKILSDDYDHENDKMNSFADELFDILEKATGVLIEELKNLSVFDLAKIINQGFQQARGASSDENFTTSGIE